MKKAIVLLSGGLDSTVTLYYALSRRNKCYCLIFDYGQKHKKEINYAIKTAKLTNCEYKVLKFQLPWSNSSLTDKTVKIPVHNKIKTTNIPSTYVPARNTIFLSFALSWADVIKADNIFIGANAIDFSGYPDCRPEYFKHIQEIVHSGIKHGKLKIQVPLLKMSKKEIVRLGYRLEVPFENTWSCYVGGKHPCNKCDSCKLRQTGFEQAYE